MGEAILLHSRSATIVANLVPYPFLVGVFILLTSRAWCQIALAEPTSAEPSSQKRLLQRLEEAERAGVPIISNDDK